MEQPPSQQQFLPDDWSREQEINVLKANAYDAERAVKALEKQLEQAKIDHERFQYSLEWHEHMLGQERARDEHNAKLAAERMGQAQAAEQFRLEQERQEALERERLIAAERSGNGHDDSASSSLGLAERDAEGKTALPTAAAAAGARDEQVDEQDEIARRKQKGR